MVVEFAEYGTVEVLWTPHGEVVRGAVHGLVAVELNAAPLNDTAYCGINPQMLAWANLAPLLSKPLNNMTLEGVCACWN